MTVSNQSPSPVKLTSVCGPIILTAGSLAGELVSCLRLYSCNVKYLRFPFLELMNSSNFMNLMKSFKYILSNWVGRHFIILLLVIYNYLYYI